MYKAVRPVVSTGLALSSVALIAGTPVAPFGALAPDAGAVSRPVQLTAATGITVPGWVAIIVNLPANEVKGLQELAGALADNGSIWVFGPDNLLGWDTGDFEFGDALVAVLVPIPAVQASLAKNFNTFANAEFPASPSPDVGCQGLPSPCPDPLGQIGMSLSVPVRDLIASGRIKPFQPVIDLVASLDDPTEIEVPTLTQTATALVGVVAGIVEFLNPFVPGSTLLLLFPSTSPNTEPSQVEGYLQLAQAAAPMLPGLLAHLVEHPDQAVGTVNNVLNVWQALTYGTVANGADIPAGLAGPDALSFGPTPEFPGEFTEPISSIASSSEEAGRAELVNSLRAAGAPEMIPTAIIQSHRIGVTAIQAQDLFRPSAFEAIQGVVTAASEGGDVGAAIVAGAAKIGTALFGDPTAGTATDPDTGQQVASTRQLGVIKTVGVGLQNAGTALSSAAQQDLGGAQQQNVAVQRTATGMRVLDEAPGDTPDPGAAFERAAADALAKAFKPSSTQLDNSDTWADTGTLAHGPLDGLSTQKHAKRVRDSFRAEPGTVGADRTRAEESDKPVTGVADVAKAVRQTIDSTLAKAGEGVHRPHHDDSTGDKTD